MKRLLGILAISALAASAFAQGTVGFANNSSELVRQWTSASDSTLITTPVGGAHIELLTALNGTPFSSLGALTASGFNPSYNTLAGFLAANTGWAAIPSTSGATTGIGPAAGRFNGGNVSLQAAIAGGAAAEYIIIGWTGSSTTWDEAILNQAFMGSSPLLTTLTGNPQGTPPVPAVLLSGSFTGLTLAPIPEPATFALAGLGLAALVAFRRRN